MICFETNPLCFLCFDLNSPTAFHRFRGASQLCVSPSYTYVCAYVWEHVCASCQRCASASVRVGVPRACACAFRVVPGWRCALVAETFPGPVHTVHDSRIWAHTVHDSRIKRGPGWQPKPLPRKAAPPGALFPTNHPSICEQCSSRVF